MRGRLARVGNRRRRAVQRGRPYLAGAAAVLALLAVLSAGQLGVLIGVALLAGLLYLSREQKARRASAVVERPTRLASPEPSGTHEREAEAARESSRPAGRASYAASFEARLSETSGLDFGQTLAQLVGIVGRRVHVLLAAAEDPWAMGEIHGTLAGGHDVSQEGETGELMLFLVDDDEAQVAGAFMIPSAEFDAGVRLKDPRDAGIAFRAGASVIWVFDEGVPEDYRRRHQRGGAQR